MGVGAIEGTRTRETVKYMYWGTEVNAGRSDFITNSCSAWKSWSIKGWWCQRAWYVSHLMQFRHSRCIIISYANSMKSRRKSRRMPSPVAQQMYTPFLFLFFDSYDLISSVWNTAQCRGQSKDKTEPALQKERDVLATTWHKYLQLRPAGCSDTCTSTAAGLVTSLASFAETAFAQMTTELVPEWHCGTSCKSHSPWPEASGADEWMCLLSSRPKEIWTNSDLFFPMLLTQEQPLNFCW